jgi:phage terminase large subunit-like protein
MDDLGLSPAERKAALAELDRFERFCAGLQLPQGHPLKLKPFQGLIVLPYFAGVRETLVMLPKGNAKTTTMAALAIYHMTTTNIPEVHVGASNRRQAATMYEACSRFAEMIGLYRSPGYQEIRVTKDKDRGFLKVMSSDRTARGELEGISPTLAVIDEAHAHINDSVYTAAHGALHKRGGTMVTISTAGSDEEGLLGRLRAEALTLPRLSRDGALTIARGAEFALLEWAATDPDDLDAVAEANPLVPKAELEKIRNSPSMTASRWARFHCNVWAADDNSWIDPGVWSELAVPIGAPEMGADIVLGLDASYSRDATALIGATISEGTPHLFVVGIWQPGGGRTVPRHEVDAAIADSFERWNVRELGCDPPGWVGEIETWEERYPERVLRFETNRPQLMSPAIDRFHAAVVERRLSHDGDAVLARHVGNARVRERGSGGISLAKASENAKIDAAVAAVIAHERAAWHVANPPKAPVEPAFGWA